MSSVPQVLTTGKPTAANYGSFGFAHKRMVPPPSRLFGLTVGRSNAGKTTFLMSYPGTLLINCDLSSTPVSNPDNAPAPAQMWPGMDGAGQFVGVDGKPIVPDWKAVEKIKEDLKTAAANNQPRPELIALDNISSAIRWMKPWVVEKMGKKDWSEIDGRKGWDLIYDKFVDFAMELRQAGYGVMYVAHLVDAVIPIGDDKNVQTIEINMSDKLYRRLYPLFDIVIGIEKRREVEIQKMRIPIQGTDKFIDRDISRTVEKRFVMVNNEKLDRILKYRVHMPGEIELGETGGWQAFADEYIKRATMSIKEA